MNIFGCGTVWLIVALQLMPVTLGGKYNVTSEDLDNCLHYIADEGYRYKKYFKIRPDMQPTRDPNDLVHLKMYVHADKDVHILLAGSVDPPLTEPVYEIVLDAGGDLFSEIRSRLGKLPIVAKRSSNVIEANEITPIVIRVTRNGHITVTVANNTEPVLSVVDPNLSPIEYLSFASWRKTTWIAYFDCHANKPNSANGNNDGDDLEAVNKQLSTSDRLKKYLLSNYDGDVVPDGLRTVATQLIVDSVDFSPESSTLTTLIRMSMHWTDRKVRWNPDEFEDMRGVRMPATKDSSLWTPDVFLFNARGDQFIALPLEMTTTAMYMGNVSADTRPLPFRSVCSNNAASIHGMWPFDELSCDIELGLVDPDVEMVPMEANSVRITDANNQDTSAWHLQRIVLLNNTKFMLDDLDTQIGLSDLVYRLTLRRNSVFYVHVFVSPLVLVHALLITSFLCDRSVNRVTQCALGLITTVVVLLFSSPYTPNSYVPTLIRYYEITLYMAWLAFVLFVIDCWMAVERSGGEPKEEDEIGGTWIGRLLQMHWVRTVFSFDLTNSYGRMDKESKPMEMNWRTILNRMAFVLYATIFFVGCCIGIRA